MMLLPLGIIAILLIDTALATYVVARAGRYRPARLFFALVLALATLQVSGLMRLEASGIQNAYLLGSASILGLCAMNVVLLLLLSAIFVPQWWEGPHLIRWMILPGILISIGLSIDLWTHAGVLVGVLHFTERGFHFVPAAPGSYAVLVLHIVGWLPHLGILVTAFVREQRMRPTIVGLAVAIVLAMVASGLDSWLTMPQWLFYLTQVLPSLLFLVVLGHAVLRVRLFEPTQAALDLALQSMSEVIAVLDRTGQVIYVNPPAARLGLGSQRSFADALREAGVAEEDVDRLVASRAAPDPQEAHKLALGESPRMLEVTLAPVADADILHGTLLMGRDITDRERHTEMLHVERARLAQAVRKLTYLAGHDALTGLPNRRSLEDDLRRIISRSRRGEEGALLFLDLDNFKLVNDTLGHAAGDQVLIAVTQVLAFNLRDGDILARLGGDEFAVILEHTSIDRAQIIAERLRAAIDAFRFTREGRVFELGLSIGLVEIDGQQNSQALLSQADIAMYTAKEQGRNQVALYHPTNDNFNQLSEASQWVTRIKDALREDRLVLHFQPVVRCSDGRIEHYEVLIRMLGQEGALIPPDAFIPSAERFGFMPQLDRWVVRQTIAALRAHPDIHLFVNFSSRSLIDETLAEFIQTQLRECAVEPVRLGFEITETAAVHDMVRAERWIRQIKALGCRFALDDFGVGFTSFAYLRSLPIDYIKIDGSFIRTLDQDASNRAIVQVLHNLAQALGKSTVAEFVESEAIAQILRDIGITYAQGYHLGRPGPLLPHARMVQGLNGTGSEPAELAAGETFHTPANGVRTAETYPVPSVYNTR